MATGGEPSLQLDRPLSDALRALSRERGVTVFMAVLATFQALLARLSGQRDFAVGSPVAGRNRRELEPLIGFFVNTLVFRAGLSGDPGYGGLLERVRQSALGAYAHQDLPFEKVVQEEFDNFYDTLAVQIVRFARDEYTPTQIRVMTALMAMDSPPSPAAAGGPSSSRPAWSPPRRASACPTT